MSGLVVQIGANVNQAVSEFKRYGFSVSELKQQIKSLEGELSNLDRQMLKSTGGRALTHELQLAKTELKSLEAQASLSGQSVGNVFTKAFGSVRQLAYILPGIGIAGIFNVAFEQVSKLFAETNKLSDAEQHLKDIRQASLVDLGKERADVDELVLLLRSENTTKKEKQQILKKLQEISPQYFSDLRLEKDLIDNLNTSYQSYLKSLSKRAEASVLTKQLEEISAKIIDLEQKGATGVTFMAEVKSSLDGRLYVSKGLTKDQKEQNVLNLGYNSLLRDRDQILSQLGLRLSSLSDNLNIGGVKLPKEKDFIPKLPTVKFPVDIVPRIFDIEKFRQAVTDTVPLTFSEVVFKHTNELIDKLAKDIKDHPNAILIDAKLRLDAGKELLKIQNELIATGQAIAGTITPAIDNMIQAIGKGENGFKAFAQGVKSAIQGVVAKLLETAAAAAIISVITGGAAGGGLSFISAFKNIFGGFRAGGGPIEGNRAYVVGERGPEIIFPGRSGTVMPNTGYSGTSGAAYGKESIEYIPLFKGTDVYLMVKRTQKFLDRNT